MGMCAYLVGMGMCAYLVGMGMCGYLVGMGMCLYVGMSLVGYGVMCGCIVGMGMSLRVGMSLAWVWCGYVWVCRWYGYVVGTGWHRCIGCIKLQAIFCKRATNYKGLLRKITCKDKESYGSWPPCMSLPRSYSTTQRHINDIPIPMMSYIHICMYIHVYLYVYV